jgi:FAD/FMN-containing dehydrogenase
MRPWGAKATATGIRVFHWASERVLHAQEQLHGIEVNKADGVARVGAGVRKNELNEALRPHGLLFGPDPSSNPCLGGMASTGGSGMSTPMYGTTKENVLSLTVVTAEGEIIETRRAVRKSSTGRVAHRAERYGLRPRSEQAAKG